MDEACICKGNWRAIVKEYGPRIGQWYKSKDGEFRFFGLVHAEDDYYYGMMGRDFKVRLLSCVGDIAAFGFEELPSPPAPDA